MVPDTSNTVERNLQPTSATTVYNISIDSSSSIAEVNERFLSIGLDSSLVRAKWLTFNMSSEKLQNMAKALAPSYLRLGGTDEEFLIFNPGKSVAKQRTTHNSENFDPSAVTAREMFDDTMIKNRTNFTMTREDFDKITKFAKDSGWFMLFGLNGFLRNVDGSWNSKNAVQLFDHVSSHGYQVGWELGNEPNRWRKFGTSRAVNGTQMGKDFRILRQILNENPKYGTFLVGPDVTRPHRSAIEFGKSFVKEADDVINAFTWHQYYINARDTTLDNFTDPNLLELLRDQIQTVQAYLEAGNNSKPIWLGETGSASGGGAKGLSDSYVGGFLYLDKLGMTAQYGYQVVIRQSLYGGYYALIDYALDPLPDFWSAVIYKKVVGTRVLQIQGGDSYVRLYAHCTKAPGNDHQKGSVTVFGMNMHKSQNAEINFEGKLSGRVVQQYLLTPSDGTLKSKEVSLNGKVLKLVEDLHVPDIYPKYVEQPVAMPPLTYAFYVIPDAGFAVCG